MRPLLFLVMLVAAPLARADVIPPGDAVPGNAPIAPSPIAPSPIAPSPSAPSPSALPRSAPAAPADNDDDVVDPPPLPSHPDVEPVGVPTEALAAPLPEDERLRDLPSPSIGLMELVGPLVKTMLMLGVVLLIVYLTLHKGLGKLIERQNVGKRVKVVERVALDQKRTLFVVEVDGQQLLLGAGENGVVQIKDLGRAPTAGPAAGVTPRSTSESGFGARFADLLRPRAPGQPADPPVAAGHTATTGLKTELQDLNRDVKKA